MTALVAAVLGLVVGSSLARSVSLGFYAVGSFLVIVGFFIGNRGPIRAKGEDAALLGLFPVRRRWADPDEHAARSTTPRCSSSSDSCSSSWESRSIRGMT